MGFKEQVLAVVQKIPEGKVLTYKAVAEKAGRSRAYRAVGNILNQNFDPLVPCHRVIRSDGRAGGYNRGTKRKIALLNKEGQMIKKRKGGQAVLDRPWGQAILCV